MDSTTLSIVLACFGCLLLAISYRRHRYHRTRSAVAHAVAGALLIAGGAFLLALALNYNTYQALQSDTPLAEVSVKKLSNQRYQLSLMRIPSGDLQVFTLQGNNWRINARVLVWKSWLRGLGLRENLRLEQLVRSSEASPTLLRRYALNGNPGINLWEWRQSHSQYANLLDIHMIETDTMPLENGARFHLYLHEGQLQSRPINRIVNTPNQPSATPVLNNQAIQLLKNSDLQVPSMLNPKQQSNTAATSAKAQTSRTSSTSSASNKTSPSSATTSKAAATSLSSAAKP